jgi:peptide chain release factor 2
VAAAPGFWDEQGEAGRQMAELSALEDDLRSFDDLAGHLEDARVLHALAQEESDAATWDESLRALEGVERSLEELEIRTLLSGEHDDVDAIASVHAGAGGTESCDWAEMLLRMFLRWCERRGFAAEVLEVQPGEEAGIKRATFTVKGRFAYGLLSMEKGVHRLVRISPFDASRRRHTSFASLDVVPALPDDVQIDIDPKELRVETYRSSGAGGQHVNVTDSAVRITHIPTNIVVAVQNERSQFQNRAVAMKILAARLAERQRQDRLKELDAIRGEQMEIGFGSQIRSYVLHPYQLAKDHRTDVEIGNVAAVLDGDIERFIAAELRRRRSAASGRS